MPVTITRIEAQKKRRQRFSLFAGDAFIMGVSLDTLTRLHISTGVTLTDDQVIAIEHAETAFQLRELGLRLLARRAHSRRELRDKLLQRNYDLDMINALLDDFSDRKFLDDAQFSRMFIEEEQRMRRSGPALVRDKLRQKGITSECIETLISEIYPPALQVDNCRYLTHKKIKHWTRPLEQKKITQLTGYLRNKGFNWDIIQQTIADIIRETSNDGA